jgi:hypothetical protein
MGVKKVANRLRHWYSVCCMWSIGQATRMICTKDSESSMNWSVMICWLVWIILPKLMTHFDRLGKAKRSWLQGNAFIKREYWWNWGHKLNQFHYNDGQCQFCEGKERKLMVYWFREWKPISRECVWFKRLSQASVHAPCRPVTPWVQKKEGCSLSGASLSE